ncbi:MAG: N-6 DNA methylase [Odoribacter sp.]|nr:N-6 DNA methylase [Bacteroidales bacterium]MCC8173772.1 N-6 DNA methylase [Odoribacter sp.]
MFPDVILYGDENLTRILQGWELKMPDIPITDETFIRDAQRKAIALGLNSCVIWNFTYVRFYIFNKATEAFEVVRQWENLQITRREDVAKYRKEWETTLKDVVTTVNFYLVTHKIKEVSIGKVISENIINLLIEEHKTIVAKHYELESSKDAILGAAISVWWNGIKEEYSFDESNKFDAFAKTVILNWAFRIIFAHLIKRLQNSALLVEGISFDTTPEEANIIFDKITSKCDFYNVFAGVEYNEILPAITWEAMVELSMFLKDNGISEINQQMLQNILENCVNTTRRELNGQYTTPKPLARILTKMTVHDWTGDCYDPCCGTGTIASALLEEKKTRCKNLEEAISTTWDSDKYSVPLQIANLSLASGETINMASRIFQSNALTMRLGKIVEIVDPKDGHRIKYAFPLQRAICSNLPFVAFENIQEDEKDLLSESVLDKKSDLSFHLILRLVDLLYDNGYMGVITSNSWLGTQAGVAFYEALTQVFDLKQVHISGSGRWFKNADVVTTILILQKKQGDHTSNTHFCIWKKPLELIERTPTWEECIINSSLLDQVQDETIISNVSYTSEEIEELHKMNISYNALFHNVRWLLKIQNKLVPLKSFFKVFRGSRRGWDDLFFPKGPHSIEDEFLYPALFNAKKVNNLIAVSDCQAFSCSKEIMDLYTNYPGAFSWIMKFEDQKNGVGKPLPQVLRRPKEKWYEMRPNEVADLFTMMNPDNRMFVGRFLRPTFINQRLIGLRPNDIRVDIDLCHALLNSVIMQFYIEAVGFGRGEGVLDINKDNISQCLMLDPRAISHDDAVKIKKIFQTLLPKGILTIDEVLGDKDWKEFNCTVLKAYGIEDSYKEIVSSIKSMRRVRKAATEKYDNSKARKVLPQYTQHQYYGERIAAEQEKKIFKRRKGIH